MLDIEMWNTAKIQPIKKSAGIQRDINIFNTFLHITLELSIFPIIPSVKYKSDHHHQETIDLILSMYLAGAGQIQFDPPKSVSHEIQDKVSVST